MGAHTHTPVDTLWMRLAVTFLIFGKSEMNRKKILDPCIVRTESKTEKKSMLINSGNFVFVFSLIKHKLLFSIFILLLVDVKWIIFNRGFWCLFCFYFLYIKFWFAVDFFFGIVMCVCFIGCIWCYELYMCINHIYMA